MLPEVRSIEPELKQILYGCVEHVQATKAALYLNATRDLNDKTYELATSYQFNTMERKVVNANDDLVDRLNVRRSSFYVNGLAADQRFAEMLFRQGNDRLLATPLFSRGRLVGFIDMRDKAGKKPFDNDDLEAARKIGEQMLRVLAKHELYGLAPLSLADAPKERPSGAFILAPSGLTPTMPPVSPLSGQVFSIEATRAIESARAQLARRQLSSRPERRIAGDAELEVVRLLLPAALAIPGAVFACFSAAGHITNPQPIVAVASIADDAMEMLQNHVRGWMAKLGQANAQMTPQVSHPFGMQVVPISASTVTSILSAPVNPHAVEGLVLTVAFERPPEAQAQRALQLFLRQIEQAVDNAIVATTGRNDKQLIAERLLEPDFQRYPDLVEHSREVSIIAARIAALLELPAAQIEIVRLAAVVHDVGLRLLDYERLYKRPTLTPEEMRGLAEHPVVGAAIVEPLLGPDVAQAVLRHHERVDGKGYPSRLSGQQIPIASRIIQIADAWVAMTSSSTYQRPIPRAQAMHRLRQGAGTQFDAAITERFLRSVTEVVV